jgi:hypothetical protein
VAVVDEWLNSLFNKKEMVHIVRIFLISKLIIFLNLFIDYLDDYDDAPVSSSKRGGGGGNTFQNSSPSGSGSLYPCSVCNRAFAADRIQKHEAACMKSHKQRRVFDSTKKRLEGTEAASFYRKGKGGKGQNEPAKSQVKVILHNQVKSNIFFFILYQIPKSSWRQKHQDFIQAIRYAKQASNYEKSGTAKK